MTRQSTHKRAIRACAKVPNVRQARTQHPPDSARAQLALSSGVPSRCDYGRNHYLIDIVVVVVTDIIMVMNVHGQPRYDRSPATPEKCINGSLIRSGTTETIILLPLRRSASIGLMALPVARWLELVMLGGDPWILPVWGAANDAIQAGRVAALTDELRQLGLHISIRLDLLPCVARRLNQETADVLAAAREHGHEHVFTQTAQGYAFPMDYDLKYRLIADIDALLFEVNACWDLMRKFFQLVRAHVGQSIVGGRDRVTDELKLALGGGSDEWFAWLDRQRNFVAHEGTPYISINMTNEGAWELLVTKEHPTTFTDRKKFFRHSELVEVARGFNGAKHALQAHLIALFR